MKAFEKTLTTSYQTRFLVVLLFLAVIFSLIILRSFFLQVIHYEEYERLAVDKNTRLKNLHVQRGQILDADDEVIAATLPTQSAFLLQDQIVGDPNKLFERLIHNMKLDAKSFKQKQENSENFIWLARHLSEEQLEFLQKEKIHGVHVTRDFRRIYPLQRFAPQLIGFTGIESNGLEGIEHRYDQHLMGKYKRENLLDILYENSLQNAQGGNLHLTINSQIQYLTDKALKRSVNKMEALSGTALVMESKTGAILAMASIPDYNPNIFKLFKQQNFYNRSIGNTYEPGSTFKTITVAIARDNNLIASNQKFFCENGSYRVLDHTIHDTTGKFGLLNISDIIKKSSNICAIKIGQRIPPKIFYEKILEFGFGYKTNVGLPGEQIGKVHPYQNWTASDVATISYGHTISVTPIQMISAINVFANKGIYISPYVIRKKTTVQGEELEIQPSQKRRVVSELTAQEITEYMTGVVSSGGTGSLARIKGLLVAGKTGTTRKLELKTNNYSTENHIFSFAGFLPADNPKLTILTIINEPQKKYRNSKSAVPLFREIAEDTLRVYIQSKKNNAKVVSLNSKDISSLFINKPTPDPLPRIKKGIFVREALSRGVFYKETLFLKGSGKAHKINTSKKKQIERIEFR